MDSQPEKPDNAGNSGKTVIGRPFPKGVSGNPSGRPKGVNLTARIIKALEADDGKQADILAKALILQAVKGNGTAIKQILDRLDGPVKEETNANHVIRVVYGDDNPPSESSPGPEDS